MENLSESPTPSPMSKKILVTGSTSVFGLRFRVQKADYDVKVRACWVAMCTTLFWSMAGPWWAPR